MSIRHNCGNEKDLELSWVDLTGNTADRIKCNICGREFIDTIFIKRLKEAQINLWENYGDGKKPYDVDEFSIMLNKEIDKLVGEKLK